MMENEEILSKVIKRADEIRFKKVRKKRKVIRNATVITSFFLLFFMAAFMPTLMTTIDTNTLVNYIYTGTIFSVSSSLGYIIMGILSFILGMIVTLICYKIKEKNERD